MDLKSHRGVDAARTITAIETTSVIGTGDPEDPVRQLLQYWTADGDLLAERDTLHPPVAGPHRAAP